MMTLTIEVVNNKAVNLLRDMEGLDLIHLVPPVETAVPQEKDAEKWVNPLRGRAKALGASLTLDRFMEMQREDLEHENEIDHRLWGDSRGKQP
jgi:hypothetical protein